MKNFMKSGLIAAAVFVGTAPTTAQAVSLEEYLECISQGGGLIDCAFGNGPNPFVSFKVPDDLAPSERDIQRAGKMVEAGVFAKYADRFGTKEPVVKGGVQTCKSAQLLDMFEKNVPPNEIGKECFEQ